MAQPLQSDRFVGTTEQCFGHLINRYPGLTIHALLAEFCLPADREKPHVGIEKVQRWQRGEYFPGGDALLRLRCFLYLSDYEVTEFKGLRGLSQRLALVVGLGIVDPVTTEMYLWNSTARTNPLNALWRILLHGDGYSESVQERIEQTLLLHKNTLTAKTRAWRTRIKEATAPFTTEPAKARATVSLPPGLPTSFERVVAATTALAGTLLSDPESRQAAVAATRGGLDLKELIGVLEQFFPKGENKA